MRAIRGSVAIVLAVCVPVAPHAAAQQAAVATLVSVEAQRVARSLEAQFTATLVRERKLADDRELQLIGPI